MRARQAHRGEDRKPRHPGIGWDCRCFYCWGDWLKGYWRRRTCRQRGAGRLLLEMSDEQEERTEGGTTVRSPQGD